MDIIEKARELGAEIQKTDEFKKYLKAKLENDDNELLHKKIDEFNLKKMSLDYEANKEEQNTEKIAALNREIKQIYGEIMNDESMIRYSEAKNGIDEIMRKIEVILSLTLSGEDPMTAVIPEPGECTGSCESCSGCH